MSDGQKVLQSVRRLILGSLWAIFCGFKLLKELMQLAMAVMIHSQPSAPLSCEKWIAVVLT